MASVPRQIAMEGAGLKESESRDVRFSELVERQARFVFRVAYAVLRNSSDAEEIVQETFLKLYRTGAWERMQEERAFLARTAWRIAVERRRPARAEAPVGELTASGLTPEEAAIAEDWNTAVHRLIDALPPHLREPLALSTIEELTSAEIAGMLGIAEGTVRTRLMRARQILRQKLEALGGGRHGS